jgi:hypothetical protein
MESGKLTYEEKFELLTKHVRFIGTGMEGEDVFRLLSLICILCRAFSKEDKVVKPIQIIVKACGKPEHDVEKDLYVRVALLADLFNTKDAKFNNYGLTKAQDMLAEIKHVMDHWCPF